MPSSTTSTSSFTFLPRGAIIQRFNIANRNIVLGFPTLNDYVNRIEPISETIGRVANRLANATIHLNGREYPLDKNDGPNCIHGGLMGWGTKDFTQTQEKRHGKDAVKFTYTSHDGDGKFPGTVEVAVWYTESQKQETPMKTVLTIEYEVSAEKMECEETAVNLTNHSYFNLSGKPTIAGTRSQLCSRRYLPVDQTGIPVGKINEFPVDSGNHLRVFSTGPSFQFYTGDHIDVSGSPSYGARAGFCVEPGRFINAVNQPEWRSMSLLRKGQVYGCKIVYEAWKE
ncbi:galactose mutarotase-like domain-containing protein [Aspergillus spinulosporus]